MARHLTPRPRLEDSRCRAWGVRTANGGWKSFWNPSRYNNRPRRDVSLMNYEQLLYEASGPVATITLNRPTRMNALTKILERELRTAMELADRDPAIRVII